MNIYYKLILIFITSYFIMYNHIFLSIFLFLHFLGDFYILITFTLPGDYITIHRHLFDFSVSYVHFYRYIVCCLVFTFHLGLGGGGGWGGLRVGFFGIEFEDQLVVFVQGALDVLVPPCGHMFGNICSG